MNQQGYVVGTVIPARQELVDSLKTEGPAVWMVESNKDPIVFYADIM